MCFVGHTNAGKTSLINSLFGTSCAVAPVAETKGATAVFENGEVRVFDVFGMNEDEVYQSTKLLMHTKTIHTAVMVYSDCIENTRRLTKTLKTLELIVIAVRNKVEYYVGNPAELNKIILGDSTQSKQYGADHWTCVSSLSGYNISILKKTILTTTSCLCNKSRESHCITSLIRRGLLQHMSFFRLSSLGT